MRLATAFIACLCLSLSGFAFAADLDNNGISGDESLIPSSDYSPQGDRTEIVEFPTSADTWEVTNYPYWWHEGDTVYGVHDVALGSVDHVDVTLKIDYTVLNSGGHVDLDFMIDGTVIGSLVITEEDGLGYVYGSWDFEPMSPPFELRWYETNTVASGAGSISLNETGECTVDFSGAVAVESDTWSALKAAYR
jgi:hypothetical protein